VIGLPQGIRVVGCSFELGGYASHRVLPTHAVVPLQDAVTHEVAATAVEGYATNLLALTRRATLRPGEWVLVLGVGGGIGLAAVDVASSLGARMIAAASSHAKRAAAINAGAEVAVDYEIEDLKARVRELTGAGAHLVVDPVGDPFAEPALRSLARARPLPRRRFRGRLHSVAAAQPRPAGEPHSYRGRLGMRGHAGSGGQPGTRGRSARPRGDRGSAPVAPTMYPLERAAEALNRLARRRVAGKLALLP
jgi:NADPH2:quinone reductase